MRRLRARVFSPTDADVLENELNDFLARVEPSQHWAIQVHYRTTATESEGTLHSALVVYLANEPVE